MIAAMIQGQLVAEPVEPTTASGSRFVTATARVAAGVEAMFVGIATFDAAACARLAKLRKGSSVAAAGMLETTAWTATDGTQRTGWRLTANEVLTLGEARRRRAPAAGDASDGDRDGPQRGDDEGNS